MANKHFYYVLIACENGQGKFVTKVDNTTKYAHWNIKDKPMEFSKKYAEDLAYCLCLNFNPAFVLRSDFKIEQHYFYKEENND